MREYVENEKPYWLYLDAERGEEMQYSLFNYFPDVHYKQAIDQVLGEEVENGESENSG